MPLNIMFFFLLFFSFFIQNDLLSQEKITTSYLMQYSIGTTGNTKKVEFLCAVPKNIPGIQEVLETNYSLKPDSLFDKNGNRYAKFVVKDISSSRKIEVKVTIRTSLFNYETKNKKTDYDLLNNTNYLAPEKYIEVDKPAIKKQATNLRGKNQLETMDSIFKFLRKKIKYNGFNPKPIGAYRALLSGHGDCTEFSDLFVSLCRANDIKARVIFGITIESEITPFHNWCEVYIEGKGWVRVDPTPYHAESFKESVNNYIQLSTVKNDKTLNNYDHWTYKYWGDPAKISDKLTILSTK